LPGCTPSASLANYLQKANKATLSFRVCQLPWKEDHFKLEPESSSEGQYKYSLLIAGTRGPLVLALLMAVYLVASVAAMCALVAVAFRGLHRLPLAGIARYVRRLTRAVLVEVDIADFFVE
jgi:hypothetical protein